MNTEESFDNSTYTDQIHLAERELASFIGAVTGLFGPEQAKLSAEDWLEESELIDSPPRSTSRDWQSVTIAAPGEAGKSADRRAASNAACRSDRYQSIANTIVQLFPIHASGLMRSSRPDAVGNAE
jgi:hypothetical protein